MVTNTTTGSTQYALVGADAMIGRQITSGLAGFLGAYFFTSSTNNFSTKPVTGPFLNTRYIWYPNKTTAFGTFDRITAETQLQYDKVRGTRWYAGVRFSLAFGRSNLHGMQRHMVDQVMRDIDIVSLSQSNNTSTTVVATNSNGSPMTGEIVSNTAALNAAIGDTNIPVIAVQGVLTNVNPTSVALATGQALTGGVLVFSYNGQTYTVDTGTTGELQSSSGISNLIKVGNNNTISDITLTMVDPANNATGNIAITTDSTVNDLGTLTIYNVSTNGNINATRDGASQKGIINISNSSFETTTWNPTGVPKIANFTVANSATMTVNIQDSSVKMGQTLEVVGIHFSSASNGILTVQQIINCDIKSTDSGINFAMNGGDINVIGDIANNTIEAGLVSHPSESGILAFGFNANNKTLTVNGSIKNNTIKSTQTALALTHFGGTAVNHKILGGIINNTMTGGAGGPAVSINGSASCLITIDGLHSNSITTSNPVGIRVNGSPTVVNVDYGNLGLSAANNNAVIETNGSPTINPGT